MGSTNVHLDFIALKESFQISKMYQKLEGLLFVCLCTKLQLQFFSLKGIWEMSKIGPMGGEMAFQLPNTSRTNRDKKLLINFQENSLVNIQKFQLSNLDDEVCYRETAQVDLRTRQGHFKKYLAQQIKLEEISVNQWVLRGKFRTNVHL